MLRVLGTAIEKEKELPITKPVLTLTKTSAKLTATERKLTTFEDIKISEIDDSKSYKPDLTKLFYNIYFKLSASPSLEWQQIFEAERRFPRHTMWRDSWIEGEYIVFIAFQMRLKNIMLMI